MEELILVIIELIIGLFDLFPPDREQDQPVATGDRVLTLSWGLPLYFIIMVLTG